MISLKQPPNAPTSGFQHLPKAYNYKPKLRKLELTSLARKNFINITLAFKWLHDLEDMDVSKLKILIFYNNIRSTGDNIIINISCTTYLGRLFTYRIVSQWNYLLSSVKASMFLTLFKQKLSVLLRLLIINHSF